MKSLKVLKSSSGIVMPCCAASSSSVGRRMAASRCRCRCAFGSARRSLMLPALSSRSGSLPGGMPDGLVLHEREHVVRRLAQRVAVGGAHDALDVVGTEALDLGDQVVGHAG